MERLNIFVAGRWREGRGEEMASVFPADGSVNARLRAANVEDVNEAVEAAERAWRAPEWRGLVPHQRASILYRVSNLILAQQEQLAELQTRDNGKPLARQRLRRRLSGRAMWAGVGGSGAGLCHGAGGKTPAGIRPAPTDDRDAGAGGLRRAAGGGLAA